SFFFRLIIQFCSKLTYCFFIRKTDVCICNQNTIFLLSHFSRKKIPFGLKINSSKQRNIQRIFCLLLILYIISHQKYKSNKYRSCQKCNCSCSYRHCSCQCHICTLHWYFWFSHCF